MRMGYGIKENKILRMAEDLLFPPRCPVCDEPVRLGEGLICAACRKKLVPVGKQVCFRCGKPILSGEEFCGDCAGKTFWYERGKALYTYESAAASIYRFKYGGRREYARFFGKEMAKDAAEFLRRVRPDGLIPVPVSAKRMKKRGYNQAGLLAEEIGRYTGIPVYPQLVRRVADTRPQKELNPKERQNNLKKAFIIARNDVKLSTVIIVDDIYTTGSTVNAVAQVLRQSGVRKVYYMALAIGEGY